MKEAANDLDPTSITTAKVIATHAAASRHNPHDTEIRTTPTLSAQPSTSMQPDRRCDDDEVRRAPRHAARPPAGCHAPRDPSRLEVGSL